MADRAVSRKVLLGAGRWHFQARTLERDHGVKMASGLFIPHLRFNALAQRAAAKLWIEYLSAATLLSNQEGPMKIKSFIHATVLCTAFMLGGAERGTQAADNNAFHFSGLTEANYAEGTRQYLVYMEDANTGELRNQAVWTRKTRIIEQNGEKLVEISQVWTSSTDSWNRKLYSLNRIADFSPLAHRTEHGKEGVISAYIFKEDAIAGDASIADNTKADFSMPSMPGTLNWELDMETFSLLPFELGRTFHMPFYHPGSKTGPAIYDYTVTGEEVLTDTRGNAIDCWILHIEYGDQGSSDFWFDKKSKQLIKMDETFGAHRRYKILLSVPFGPAERMRKGAD